MCGETFGSVAARDNVATPDHQCWFRGTVVKTHLKLSIANALSTVEWHGLRRKQIKNKNK